MGDVPTSLESLRGQGSRVEASSKPRAAISLETRSLGEGTKEKIWSELVEGGKNDNENSKIGICVDASADLVLVRKSLSSARSVGCRRARDGADIQNPAQRQQRAMCDYNR